MGGGTTFILIVTSSPFRSCVACWDSIFCWYCCCCSDGEKCAFLLVTSWLMYTVDSLARLPSFSPANLGVTERELVVFTALRRRKCLLLRMRRAWRLGFFWGCVGEYSSPRAGMGGKGGDMLDDPPCS